MKEITPRPETFLIWTLFAWAVFCASGCSKEPEPVAEAQPGFDFSDPEPESRYYVNETSEQEAEE
jgi:hypothetical protein